MRLIISGGGTGGHIYPAIAIANEVKTRIPDAEILFVGAQGKMEMEKVPAAGYPIKGLWISGLQRQLSLKNLSFPFKVLSSLREASRIVRDFKPDAVVGVGGYASGPLLWAATRRRVPALIQEQNSFAGITNKLLAKRVQRICVAYDNMHRFFPSDKIRITGNPVRQDILDLSAKREKAWEHFQLKPELATLLIIGGSQGARSINQSIAAGLSQLLERPLQLLWQTGKNSFHVDPSQLTYTEHPNVHQHTFLYEMDLAYAAADLVVSRAGALSVSELCIAGKPAIFVPLPSAAEDHQTQNAKALSEANAAFWVRDADAPSQLIPEILQLFDEPERQKQYAQKIKHFAKPEACKEIVDELLGMRETI